MVKEEHLYKNLLMDKRIIVVLGKTCSGKTTFARNLVNHTLIDIGCIVRKLKHNESRIHDKSLDKAIIAELDQLLESKDNLTIVGIRQLNILQHICTKIALEELQLIYLDVSLEELKRRFINRDDLKDTNFSFEEVCERDASLGFDEMEQFVCNNKHLFTIIDNY